MLLRQVHRSHPRMLWVRWGSTGATSTVHRTEDGDDPFGAVFDEIASCDTSMHSEKRLSPKVTETERVPLGPSAPPVADARVKLEEAKHNQLRRQLRDATEELEALMSEDRQAAVAKASAAYVPAKAAKTFLSSAELIQEKAPQEFVALENSKAELDRAPTLRHSGCSAVVTLVGVVTEPPSTVSVQLPGTVEMTDCVEFVVRYDVPFLQTQTSMGIVIRAVGASLSTFALESVSEGDIVHVLGHLVPLIESPGRGHQCCVYALPVGGNISVVLSKPA